MNWLSKLFKDINPFKGKTVYERYTMGDAKLNLIQEKLFAKNKKLLLDNQVPIGKVRFVFSPMFDYDVDKNIINPKYVLMLPIDAKTGKFVKNVPEISVNKPHNLIKTPVVTFCVEDNYAFIKEIVKKSKRGIVIFLADEMVYAKDKGVPMHYYSGVDADCIRFTNLDEVVERYKKQGLL